MKYMLLKLLHLYEHLLILYAFLKSQCGLIQSHSQPMDKYQGVHRVNILVDTGLSSKALWCSLYQPPSSLTMQNMLWYNADMVFQYSGNPLAALWASAIPFLYIMPFNVTHCARLTSRKSGNMYLIIIIISYLLFKQIHQKGRYS